jgi:protein-export chaperone SecB
MPGKPAPGFYVERHYLKDLSFENPAGPMEIKDAGAIRTRVGGSINSYPLGRENRYCVETTLNIDSKIEGRQIFLCELTYVADVELTQVPQPVQEQILSVDVPNFLMPQINAIIDYAVKAGGFTELKVKKIDFLALFNNARRRRVAE